MQRKLEPSATTVSAAGAVACPRRRMRCISAFFGFYGARNMVFSALVHGDVLSVRSVSGGDVDETSLHFSL